MANGYYECGFSGNQDSSFLPDDIMKLMSNGAIKESAQEALDFIDKEYVR
jgi:hypothetical protein